MALTPSAAATPSLHVEPPAARRPCPCVPRSLPACQLPVQQNMALSWSSEPTDLPAESEGDVDGVEDESSAASCRSEGRLPPLRARVCAASWTLPLNTLRAVVAAPVSKPMYTSWGRTQGGGGTADAARLHGADTCSTPAANTAIPSRTYVYKTHGTHIPWAVLPTPLWGTNVYRNDLERTERDSHQMHQCPVI